MNVLFVGLGVFDNLSTGSVHIDILKEFVRNGHKVYLLCKTKSHTRLSKEYGINILRVKIRNINSPNLIKKGLSTVMVENHFKKAVKQYFFNIKLNLIFYTTPPVTFANVIKYVKKRDGASSYLMLKDIFPQNAVDIGMLKKNGLKGIIYRYFRRKEKKLYEVSDRIGCMSRANVDYLLKHNPEIPPEKVEICPNSIEVRDLSLNDKEKIEMRRKYDLPLDKKIFVYGGNLGKPQGIPFLMDCLSAERDNPDVFFLIAGNGTEYGKLEAFVNENVFSNIRLLKSLPKKDYDRLVAACDVGMIFLDHRFTIPNFPSRLLSYMQAKIPVLAATDPNTDIGKVIVEGNFGLWCESNDVDTFCETVQRFLSEDTPEKGRNGFEYLQKHYSVQNAYQTIINHIEINAEDRS